RGSKPSIFARSSQNEHPVAGSKCHATTSRTHRSSASRASFTRSAAGVATPDCAPCISFAVETHRYTSANPGVFWGRDVGSGEHISPLFTESFAQFSHTHMDQDNDRPPG